MQNNILTENCLWLLQTIQATPILNYFIAFLVAYGVIGFIADNFLGPISLRQWERIRKSINEANKEIKEKKEEIPRDEFAGEWRSKFSWMTRRIGIIERIFYTTAIIFNHLEFIGFWLAIKAIGEWRDGFKEKGFGKVTRIRINNFLIMSGYSLLYSFVASLLFKIIIDINLLMPK